MWVARGGGVVIFLQPQQNSPLHDCSLNLHVCVLLSTIVLSQNQFLKAESLEPLDLFKLADSDQTPAKTSLFQALGQWG